MREVLLSDHWYHNSMMTYSTEMAISYIYQTDFYHNNIIVQKWWGGEIMWSAEPSLFLIAICGRFHLLVRIRFSKRFPERTPLSNSNNTIRNGSFHYDWFMFLNPLRNKTKSMTLGHPSLVSDTCLRIGKNRVYQSWSRYQKKNNCK